MKGEDLNIERILIPVDYGYLMAFYGFEYSLCPGCGHPISFCRRPYQTP